MFDSVTKLVYKLKIKQGRAYSNKLYQMLENPVERNRNLLLRLIDENKDTEYGKKYDFASIKTVEDYQKRVPLTTYDDYYPYIARMMKGEKNLISSKDVFHYAATSGSVDNPKKVPVTQESYDIFTEYATSYSIYMAKNHCGKKWKQTRGLNLIEVSPVQYINGVPFGSISGKTVENYQKFLNLLFVSPQIATFPTTFMDLKYIHLRYALAETKLSYLVSPFMSTAVDLMKYLEKNWQLLVSDLEAGTIAKSVKIQEEQRAILEKSIRPQPERAKELRKEFEKGFKTPIIPRIWKELAWLSGIGGGSFLVYTEKMKKYSGDIPIYYSIYGASEGLVALPLKVNTDEMVLVPDSMFYEFIPIYAADEISPDKNQRPLTMGELKIGKDYEVILTNLSGFYRYCIKDAIRVVGFHNGCPIIKFVYRLNQSLNIAEEKTNDECIGWAVAETAKEAGFDLVEYSGYADTDCIPGHYVILIEGENFTKGKDLSKITHVMEEKLAIANPYFGKKVREGVFAPTVVHLLQSETYALYKELMIERGVSANQLKPVRLIDTPVRKKFFLGLIDKEL